MRPGEVAARWIEALNDHDFEAAAACFDPGYRDVGPAGGGELGAGRERARSGFASLFADVADLRAELLSAVEQGATVWLEWRMWGVRSDGSPIEFAGVSIFGVADDCFRWGRAYTEVYAALAGGHNTGGRRLGAGAQASAAGDEAVPIGRGCELCREIESGSLIAAIRLRHSPDCPLAAVAAGVVEDAYGQVGAGARRAEPDSETPSAGESERMLR